jgi:hypothetical protein
MLAHRMSHEKSQRETIRDKKTIPTPPLLVFFTNKPANAQVLLTHSPSLVFFTHERDARSLFYSLRNCLSHATAASGYFVPV